MGSALLIIASSLYKSPLFTGLALVFVGASFPALWLARTVLRWQERRRALADTSHNQPYSRDVELRDLEDDPDPDGGDDTFVSIHF
jgi:hypothetical protein